MILLVIIFLIIILLLIKKFNFIIILVILSFFLINSYIISFFNSLWYYNITAILLEIFYAIVLNYEIKSMLEYINFKNVYNKKVKEYSFSTSLKLYSNIILNYYINKATNN